MLELIDRLLNRTTMYRLVLYVCVAELALGAVLGGLGILPFSPVALILSTAVITATCILSNVVFARIMKAPVNRESAIITALILALIISPIVPFQLPGLGFLVWASLLAMASKYVIAADRDHVFNPAAFAVVITAVAVGQSASWWVGSMSMLPAVAIGGAMIVRKIRREDLVWSFFAAALVTGAVTASSGSALLSMERAVLHTPLIFFATLMLTEPLTTPPTRSLRIAYGAFVGFLSAPAIHVGAVYSTPELALVVGNLFSYAVSPTGKHLLTLTSRVQLSRDSFEFVFSSPRPVPFRAGQYMEWTLPHRSPDDRGVRRYFTMSSSPEDRMVKVGIKFCLEPSSFKKQMGDMVRGDVIMAGEIAGDFVLPRNRRKKLAFVAGGIGVTPFRSMVQSLIDRGESRDVVLLYANKTVEDIAYRDVFDEARTVIGMKTSYALSEVAQAPPNWNGPLGMLDARTIAEEIPDYADRLFYISGPHGMVTAFESSLAAMGVSHKNIKTDYFPGFV